MASKGKVFDVAVPGILLVNILVFAVWNFVPDMAPFIQNNFVISREALSNYRFWTLITANFAHHDVVHLMVTSLTLIIYGFLLEDLLGSKWFLEIYLMAGLIGGLNNCMIAPLLGHPEAQVYGAGSALTGVMTLGACIYGQRLVKAFGFLPVRPVWGLTLFLGVDFFGLLAPNAYVGLAVGHGSHLAAAIVSILFYHYILRFRVWRNLKSYGDGDIVPINLMGYQNWVIPCRDAEEFENTKAFFKTTLGLNVKAELAHSDVTKSPFVRTTTFKVRSGTMEVAEVNRNQNEIYRAPIPSLTVSNFAQSLASLELKKYRFVTPLFRPKKRWAVTYFEGPNAQIYQIQGPYLEEQ